MKEYELTEKDFSQIKELALKYYMSYTADENILAKAYFDAIMRVINTKGLIVKDGKLFNREKI